MSPNTIKKKCQNFLSTLIKLAGDQTSKTASNVKKLIQNLIVSILGKKYMYTFVIFYKLNLD